MSMSVESLVVRRFPRFDSITCLMLQASGRYYSTELLQDPLSVYGFRASVSFQAKGEEDSLVRRERG